MSLTDYERLNLLNQFLILKESGSDFYDSEQLNLMINTLKDGHTSFYDELIFSTLEKEITDDITEEIFDILSLKSRSLVSLRNVKEPIHADLEEFLLDRIFFFGFDGNDELEAQYLRQSEYIVYQLNRFEILFDKSKGRASEDFNSHFKTLSIFRSELKRHAELYRSYEENLTLEDLKHIYLAEVTSH